MYAPSDPDAIVIREERKLTISSDFELYGIGTVVAPLKAKNQKEKRWKGNKEVKKKREKGRKKEREEGREGGREEG